MEFLIFNSLCKSNSFCLVCDTFKMNCSLPYTLKKIMNFNSKQAQNSSITETFFYKFPPSLLTKLFKDIVQPKKRGSSGVSIDSSGLRTQSPMLFRYWAQKMWSPFYVTCTAKNSVECCDVALPLLVLYWYEEHSAARLMSWSFASNLKKYSLFFP